MPAQSASAWKGTVMELNKLLRKNIRDLKPYQSARHEFSGRANIFLDANENALGSVAESGQNRYPDPFQIKLKDKIGELKNVPAERIFLGNGSDEVIDLLIRAFCEPRRERIMVLPPTYGMYGVCAAINDVEVVKIPLTEQFQPDLPEIEAALNSGLKLIFLCSPNNPSANLLDNDKVLKIIDMFDGLVVIDEAYIDFAGNEGWLNQLDKYDNLVVMQTFSKAWGMAGIRLGMAFAHPEIIIILNNIKPPYNINRHTQEVALKALGESDIKNKYVDQLLKQRQRLTQALKNLSMVQRIYPSDANFLLVKFNDPGKVYQQLMKQGIIVRDRSRMIRCEGCLRITVGSAGENNQLITVLKEMDK